MIHCLRKISLSFFMLVIIGSTIVITALNPQPEPPMNGSISIYLDKVTPSVGTHEYAAAYLDSGGTVQASSNISTIKVSLMSIEPITIIQPPIGR